MPRRAVGARGAFQDQHVQDETNGLWPTSIPGLARQGREKSGRFNSIRVYVFNADKMTATDVAPQESGDTTSGAGVSIITSSMKTLLASQHSLINTRFCFFLFFNGSAENSQKSPPDWGRLEYAIFLTNIVTKHANSPCVESTQSVLVSGQFWKLQLMSSSTILRTTLHASAVVMTLEVKVELSTRTEKDKVYTTISPITLHAGAIETTIES